MDKTAEIARLMRGGSFHTTLERIPVKHLGFQTYPAMMFERGARYDMEESGGFAAPELPARTRPAK